MSDELASKTATLEQPSDKGQAERASEQRPQGHTDGQPSDKGQAATEQDNIRKLQSAYDKRLADERKQFQTEMQRRDQMVQQLQQRLNQMEENSAPDDFARMELKLKRAEEQAAQYAQAYQQSLQAQQAEQARQAALREVAEEFGVTVKDLEGATDYLGAVKLAVKAQRDKETRKQEDDEQRARDNAPDVGGGAPRTTMSQWEREWQTAKEAKDSLAMMRLARTQPKGAKK